MADRGLLIVFQAHPGLEKERLDGRFLKTRTISSSILFL